MLDTRVSNERLSKGESISTRLELKPVRRAARLVVLEVDGASEKSIIWCRHAITITQRSTSWSPAGGGREVNLVLGQLLLLLGHPVAESVRVVGGDDCDL